MRSCRDRVPVEWLPLTSLAIDTEGRARPIVRYHCIRRMVEVHSRVLKSGWRVEGRRFGRMDRLLPCLPAYPNVAWRTSYVRRPGRGCPEISRESVFEPGEWRSADQVVRREEPPARPPTLQAMARPVAHPGGHADRRRADDPGPQTVWPGSRRLHGIAVEGELV